MAVLEAWSYGLPVAITDGCNLPIGFERGAAVRIDADADGIADVLPRLLSRTDSELAEIGMAGRRLVEDTFTWNRVARDMAAVYRWVLGAERPSCVEFA
jgi:poly(glycerol-phosphate) alpha-glucosyltransferase